MPSRRELDAAYEEFVTATVARLLRTATFLVYDRHLAEDLVQMTYERVARRWRRVMTFGNPEAYARKILVNLAIDERRLRRAQVPMGSAAEIDALASAGRAVGDAAADVALRAELAALPARQRAVVVLRYWCDMSEREIADTLGLSTGTVKSHAARALSALRTRMSTAEGRAR